MSLVLYSLHLGSDIESAKQQFSSSDWSDLNPVDLKLNGKPIKFNVDLNHGYYTVGYHGKDGILRQYLRRGGWLWDDYIQHQAIEFDSDNFMLDGNVFAQWVGVDPIPGYVAVMTM